MNMEVCEQIQHTTYTKREDPDFIFVCFQKFYHGMLMCL